MVRKRLMLRFESIKVKSHKLSFLKTSKFIADNYFDIRYVIFRVTQSTESFLSNRSHLLRALSKSSDFIGASSLLHKFSPAWMNKLSHAFRCSVLETSLRTRFSPILWPVHRQWSAIADWFLFWFRSAASCSFHLNSNLLPVFPRYFLTHSLHSIS